MEQDLLPEAGLLLLEKMGFSEVRYFHQFHGEKEDEDLGKAIRINKILGGEQEKTALEKELEYAMKLKEAFGDYSKIPKKCKADFAFALLEDTRLLSKSCIARIAEIDRHRL